LVALFLFSDCFVLYRVQVFRDWLLVVVVFGWGFGFLVSGFWFLGGVSDLLIRAFGFLGGAVGCWFRFVLVIGLFCFVSVSRVSRFAPVLGFWFRFFLLVWGGVWDVWFRAFGSWVEFGIVGFGAFDCWVGLLVFGFVVFGFRIVWLCIRHVFVFFCWLRRVFFGVGHVVYWVECWVFVCRALGLLAGVARVWCSGCFVLSDSCFFVFGFVAWCLVSGFCFVGGFWIV